MKKIHAQKRIYSFANENCSIQNERTKSVTVVLARTIHIRISSQFDHIHIQFSYKYFIWYFTVWSAFTRQPETKCKERMPKSPWLRARNAYQRSIEQNDDNPRPLESERFAAGFDVGRRVRIGGYSGAHNETDYVRAPCGVPIWSQRACAQGVFSHKYGLRFHRNGCNSRNSSSFHFVVVWFVHMCGMCCVHWVCVCALVQCTCCDKCVLYANEE